ncbi:MAG: hypothetical protein U5K00_05205 [Melioribacteraceae bacterium]|nr:hypothetical protein [Melioribacteraceae bacterium]
MENLEAIVIANFDADSLIWDGARYLIPSNTVLDGVEHPKRSYPFG